jgi:hypothetical protein
MAIFDSTVVKQILLVTCSILEKNFFYSKEAIQDFLDVFTEELGDELENFEMFAEPDILDTLHRGGKPRLYFTCYFTSAQLRYIFLNHLHFTEQELHAFENILPKYTGETRYEKQQQPQHKGTDNRKFFK